MDLENETIRFRLLHGPSAPDQTSKTKTDTGPDRLIKLAPSDQTRALKYTVAITAVKPRLRMFAYLLAEKFLTIIIPYQVDWPHDRRRPKSVWYMRHHLILNVFIVIVLAFY